GQGGLLHHGQGKWYPGEPLPRWALGLYWRRDGLPVWRAADPPIRPARRPDATSADALGLIQRLARRLGVDPAHILPAREDPLLWIKAEGD
ncbi:transglutaminase family protein, partial [Lacticaseibacillus paracasei]